VLQYQETWEDSFASTAGQGVMVMLLIFTHREVHTVGDVSCMPTFLETASTRYHREAYIHINKNCPKTLS